MKRMNQRRLRLIAGLLSAVLATAARATVPESGFLLASEDCPAFSSLKQRSNPGSVELVPDQAYKVLGRNRQGGDYLLLQVPGAKPKQRWVAASCGALTADCPGTESVAAPQKNVLAVSWQPAFCQRNQRKEECRSQRPGRFDATNFTLHGLWPESVYCGLSQRHRDFDQRGQWHQLPEPDLRDDTWRQLGEQMPGLVSNLHRHEWVKHGTCYSATAQEYYSESLALLGQLNGSAVQDLVEDNIGRSVTAAQIRTAFDRAFGRGAGERVSVHCSRDGERWMIGELRLNLFGDIAADSSLGELLLAAEPVSAGRCSRGVIDAVGF